MKLRFFRSSTERSDEFLLLRYRDSGNLEWLGELYARHTELVYGLCLKYLNGEAAAEDAVMAIFEELTQKAKAHQIEHFRPWLYVMARNHCLMQLRKESRHPVENVAPDLMHFYDGRHPIEETDPVAENDREILLRDCIERLSGQQRRCIELFYYEDRSYQEIAQLLSEQLGMVRSHIQNGRRNLKLCVEKKEKGGDRPIRIQS